MDGLAVGEIHPHAVGAVTFVGSLSAVFGLSAGAVDELDFWGGTFLLVVFGTIQALVFSFVLGRRPSAIRPGDSVAFALMNDGSRLSLPRFLRPVIRYVCPAYLIVLLVSFTLTDGLPILTLGNVPADAKVSFLGGEFSQVGFTWAFRGFLLLVVLLLNLAIFRAWRKGGTAERGRSESIHKMPVGNSDDEDAAESAEEA